MFLAKTDIRSPFIYVFSLHQLLRELSSSLAAKCSICLTVANCLVFGTSVYSIFHLKSCQLLLEISLMRAVKPNQTVKLQKENKLKTVDLIETAEIGDNSDVLHNKE